MRPVIRYRNPFSDEYEPLRGQVAEDVAYARALAKRDGVPSLGSEEVCFHETNFLSGRVERRHPMVSFRLASGTPCALLAVPYASDENVITGERFKVIRLDTGTNHGELSVNIVRGHDTIKREQDSIVKMCEADGTPKGLRGAFHIDRAHTRIASVTEDMNRLSFAVARLQAGPTEPA